VSGISFVVVSTPRSGTGYTAKLLQSLGIDCTHERYCIPCGNEHDDLLELHPVIFHAGVFEGLPWGDASWMHAPYLSRLPLTTKVLHQVRDPVKTINSIIHSGHVDLEGGGSYRAFVRQRVSFGNLITNPYESHEAQQLALAQYFWLFWNESIEAQARTVKHPYFRYRVEDVTDNMLMRAIGIFNLPELIFRWKHVEQSPDRDFNTRGACPEICTPENLSPGVRALARRYGYDYY
jgi:hypothetical protein